MAAMPALWVVMVMMHVHAGLIGGVSTADVGVEVVVATDGGVAIDQALLNLLGLLGCQNEFVGLRRVMNGSRLGRPPMHGFGGLISL